MCKTIKCIHVSHPSKMFKEGRQYRVIDVTGFYNNMLVVIDDLGHERVINSDSMKFLLGSGRNFREPNRYAFFDVTFNENLL